VNVHASASDNLRRGKADGHEQADLEVHVVLLPEEHGCGERAKDADRLSRLRTGGSTSAIRC
ncbi:MAG: hypothetical protein ACREX8_03475, partial [Gammaproteobacteria bacterium]